VTISEYLFKLEAVLRSNPLPYFPMDKEERKRQNLKLGREFGFGLGIFEDWVSYAQTTYSRFIVRNSLDSVGVVIDNKEWMRAIKEGIQSYKAKTGGHL